MIDALLFRIPIVSTREPSLRQVAVRRPRHPRPSFPVADWATHVATIISVRKKSVYGA